MVSLYHSHEEQLSSNLPVFNNWHTSCIYVRLPSTFIGVCMILDMRTLTCTLTFLPYELFNFFKIFLVFRISYCLKTYCYIFDLYLFILVTDRFFTIFVCFKETLCFDFAYKLFNKYFSLPQSTCQFRMSVRK